MFVLQFLIWQNLKGQKLSICNVFFLASVKEQILTKIWQNIWKEKMYIFKKWKTFSGPKFWFLILPWKICGGPIRPVNLHPLFLKIGHPAFWKMGLPAFCKKQAEKFRVILYSKREENRLPPLFLNYNDLGFLHSVFFKKQGARFLRLVGADWLSDWLRLK